MQPKPGLDADSQGIPYEMSEAVPANRMAPVHSE